MKRWVILFASLLATILSACAGERSPEDTVERYLQAKVAGDVETVQGLLCTEMENVLIREANAFSSVSAAIERMDCRSTGADTVTCSGQIVAAYGTENTTFPLGTYRVVREDDSWKWCGEAR
jgi:hypothetical protein